jgi:hypothetical protein
MPYAITGILALIAAIIAIFEIFKFKNRILQLKLGFLNSLIMASTIGLTFWFSSQGQKEWIHLSGALGQYMLPGFMLPAAGMLFNVIANRFIRKDENLVRSVDRLR